MSLPFLDSDTDMHLNLGALLIVMEVLSKTRRGRLVLNNGRLHIFLYLVKNPVALNNVLNLCGKDSVILMQVETYSINAISPNFDTLFDRAALKSLLITLVSKDLIEVHFKKKDGFFYALTERGVEMSLSLNSDYFSEIRSSCVNMMSIQSLSESKLNDHLNEVIRRESSL